ncbi:MAG: hypothetical protein ACXADC_05070 [Candidatus Thorarchaeota archaeon]|jgi:hypothetical protein
MVLSRRSRYAIAALCIAACFIPFVPLTQSGSVILALDYEYSFTARWIGPPYHKNVTTEWYSYSGPVDMENYSIALAERLVHNYPMYVDVAGWERWDHVKIGTSDGFILETSSREGFKCWWVYVGDVSVYYHIDFGILLGCYDYDSGYGTDGPDTTERITLTNNTIRDLENLAPSFNINSLILSFIMVEMAVIIALLENRR